MSGVWAPARARIDTHLRWTCGQFAVEGVVSDDVEHNEADSDDKKGIYLGTGHG